MANNSDTRHRSQSRYATATFHFSTNLSACNAAHDTVGAQVTANATSRAFLVGISEVFAFNLPIPSEWQLVLPGSGFTRHGKSEIHLPVLAPCKICAVADQRRDDATLPGLLLVRHAQMLRRRHGEDFVGAREGAMICPMAALTCILDRTRCRSPGDRSR